MKCGGRRGQRSYTSALIILLLQIENFISQRLTGFGALLRNCVMLMILLLRAGSPATVRIAQSISLGRQPSAPGDDEGEGGNEGEDPDSWFSCQ